MVASTKMQPKINLISRNCPVCGEDPASGRVVVEADFDPEAWGAFAFASRKLPEYMHYRQIYCPRCQVQYASPIPSEEMLAQAYTEADFDSGTEAAFAARTYGAQLPRILPNLSGKGAAMDIGTGDGAFLKELIRVGFQKVVGVEPSLAPIEAAAPEIRPLIRRGLFRVEDFPGERFDLITCFQTIEHLYEPRGFCEAAHLLLNDKGALLLICHNRESAVNKTLGTRSPIYDIEHLQLFSPRSAENLLTSAGFANVQSWPIRNTYPLRYWARLFPFPKQIKAGILRSLQTSALGSLPVSLPVGNLAVVGYRAAAV